MGAKFDYCAVFSCSRNMPKWSKLATVGFAAVWKRFGKPTTLSLQNYVRQTVKNGPLQEGLLDENAPPKVNEIIVLYAEPMPTGALLYLCREGRYFLVGASVEESCLDETVKLVLFEELGMSLREFGPIVLVAGEEALSVSDELVERVVAGERGPIPEFGAELVSDFGGGSTGDEVAGQQETTEYHFAETKRTKSAYGTTIQMIRSSLNRVGALLRWKRVKASSKRWKHGR